MRETEVDSDKARQITLEAFKGDTRPATVEMVAKAYSTLFAQQDALISLFSMVMKTQPDLIFTDEFIKVQKQIEEGLGLLVDNLIELSESRDQGDG